MRTLTSKPIFQLEAFGVNTQQYITIHHRCSTQTCTDKWCGENGCDLFCSSMCTCACVYGWLLWICIVLYSTCVLFGISDSRHEREMLWMWLIQAPSPRWFGEEFKINIIYATIYEGMLLNENFSDIQRPKKPKYEMYDVWCIKTKNFIETHCLYFYLNFNLGSFCYNYNARIYETAKWKLDWFLFDFNTKNNFLFLSNA